MDTLNEYWNKGARVMIKFIKLFIKPEEVVHYSNSYTVVMAVKIN